VRKKLRQTVTKSRMALKDTQLFAPAQDAHSYARDHVVVVVVVVPTSSCT
jgi:hypothetical protein